VCDMAAKVSILHASEWLGVRFPLPGRVFSIWRGVARLSSGGDGTTFLCFCTLVSFYNACACSDPGDHRAHCVVLHRETVFFLERPGVVGKGSVP
jgi:hypothetical protein